MESASGGGELVNSVIARVVVVALVAILAYEYILKPIGAKIATWGADCRAGKTGGIMKYPCKVYNWIAGKI